MRRPAPISTASPGATGRGRPASSRKSSAQTMAIPEALGGMPAYVPSAGSGGTFGGAPKPGELEPERHRAPFHDHGLAVHAFPDRRHEHAHDGHGGKSEERPPDASDLGPDKDGEDRHSRMQADRVPGDSGCQEVVLGHLHHGEEERDPEHTWEGLKGRDDDRRAGSQDWAHHRDQLEEESEKSDHGWIGHPQNKTTQPGGDADQHSHRELRSDVTAQHLPDGVLHELHLALLFGWKEGRESVAKAPAVH